MITGCAGRVAAPAMRNAYEPTLMEQMLLWGSIIVLVIGAITLAVVLMRRK